MFVVSNCIYTMLNTREFMMDCCCDYADMKRLKMKPTRLISAYCSITKTNLVYLSMNA